MKTENDFLDVVRDGSSLALQVSYLKFEPKVSNFPVIKAKSAFITRATMGSLWFCII